MNTERVPSGLDQSPVVSLGARKSRTEAFFSLLAGTETHTCRPVGSSRLKAQCYVCIRWLIGHPNHIKNPGRYLEILGILEPLEWLAFFEAVSFAHFSILAQGFVGCPKMSAMFGTLLTRMGVEVCFDT